MPTRSVIGGRNWKRLCVDTLRSERQTIRSLTRLMQVANTQETVKLLAGEIQAALDRIEFLEELKVYECPAFENALEEAFAEENT